MFSEKNFNNKEFTNNSKKILAYTLNNGSKSQDDNINENDVLFDIFSLNDLETDTVRLSASTIKQLFEDTGYNLKDVTENKEKNTRFFLSYHLSCNIFVEKVA